MLATSLHRARGVDYITCRICGRSRRGCGRLYRLASGYKSRYAYYQDATRDALYSSGDKQPIDAGLDSRVGILRGVHFTEVGGYIVDPQFLLPFGELEAKDDLSALGDAKGFGDLILAATVWLVNQPESSTYFGITPFVYVPTGDYKHDDALNLGENRWKFVLQGGYITGLSDKWTLDLIGDVTLYGENDEFGASKATMKQDPSVQLQGFLRYQLAADWDLRGGLSHTFGGETEVGGVNQDDRIKTSKFTLGTSWFVTPTLQFIVNYGRDIEVENGFEEQHRLNLRVLKIL